MSEVELSGHTLCGAQSIKHKKTCILAFAGMTRKSNDSAREFWDSMLGCRQEGARKDAGLFLRFAPGGCIEMFRDLLSVVLERKILGSVGKDLILKLTEG